MKIAILVDGGFYRKRMTKVKGNLTPKQAAEELYQYCQRHLYDKQTSKDKTRHELYRIFYYDCPPLEKKVNHPYDNELIDFSVSTMKQWTDEFFSILSHKRKVALRLGELNDKVAHFNLKPAVSKKLINGSKTVDQIVKEDFRFNVQQKGVDMKIGLDILTLALKQQVEQIVLIAGDSDFVPAAKMARREGIDFVLDPLGNKIKDNLSLHIDGLRTCDREYLGFEKKIKKEKPIIIAKATYSAAELRFKTKGTAHDHIRRPIRRLQSRPRLL